PWWRLFTTLTFTGPDFFFDGSNFVSEAYKKDQPCSAFSSAHYASKARRYPSNYNPQSGSDGDTEEEENKTNYRVYRETGLCPIAFNMKALIEEVGKSGYMVSTTNLHNYSAYTKRFYGVLLQPLIDLDDYIENNSFKIFQWVPTVSGSSNEVLTVDFTNSGEELVMTLDQLDWNNYGASGSSGWIIDRVRQIYVTSSSAFTIEIVTDGGDVELIDCTTTLNMTSCNFFQVPQPSPEANALKSLMNALLIPNPDPTPGTYFTNDIASSSSSSPTELFGSSYPNSSFQALFAPLKPYVTSLDPAEEWVWKATEKSSGDYPENYFYIEDAQSASPLKYKITFCNAPSSADEWYDVARFSSIVPVDGTGCSSCGFTPTFKATVEFLDNTITPEVICGRIELLTGTSTELSIINMGLVDYPEDDQYDCKEQNQILTKQMEDFMGQVDIFENALGPPQSVAILGSSWSSDITIPLLLATKIAIPGQGSWSTTVTDLLYQAEDVTQPTYVDIYLNSISEGPDYCPTRLEVVEGGGAIEDVVSLEKLYVDEKTVSADGQQHYFFMLGTLNNDRKVVVRGYNECIDFQNCIECVQTTPFLGSCQEYGSIYSSVWATNNNFPVVSAKDFCEYNLTRGYIAYADFATEILNVTLESPHFIDIITFVNNDLHEYWDAYKDLFTNSGSFAFPSPSDPQYITLWEFAQLFPSDECIEAYKDAYDSQTNAISFQYFADYCQPRYYCSPLPIDEFPTDVSKNTGNPCDSGLYHVALANGMAAYLEYLENVKKSFRKDYREHFASSTIETLDLTRDEQEYQHTLYYYDQAGNLVRTVPPEGVEYIAQNDISQVQTDRYTGVKTIFTDHKLATTYEYNSFGQVTKQNTPDGGTTEFWYDSVGRLKASQNANQADELYSYTSYDAIGRIIESGEVSAGQAPSATQLDDPDFPTAWGTDKTEVTRTFYDEVILTAAAGYLGNFQNYLHNRISAVAYYSTYSGNDESYDNATHYSYDEHGNVALLVQDKPSHFSINQQRFKSIAYEYDLVGGNVNKV
ncbi:MAG: hypothetical protein ACPF9D_07175, partial [Owenweeksia sp.]